VTTSRFLIVPIWLIGGSGAGGGGEAGARLTMSRIFDRMYLMKIFERLPWGLSKSYSLYGLGRSISSAPSKIISGAFHFIWPKEVRRRYRTVIFAIFLLAFLSANLNYPNYWNKFADWVNPTIDAVKSDRLKEEYGMLKIPHFWDVPFSLGLGLQGGLHLIYQADLSQSDPADHKESMEGLRDVIERRVNLFGVREPQVLVQKRGSEYRLLVELAGFEDFNRAIELIGETPYLEFKEERPADDQKRALREVFKETEGQPISDEQLLNICANVDPQLIFAIESSTGEDPCFQSIIPVPLTGKYLRSSSIQFDTNTNQPFVNLELDEVGAEIFASVTERNIGKPLAIYLDGILINWPRVNDKISGGRAQITGFTIEGAKLLARNLNAGALPVRITLISQQSIGASLGEESLNKSLRAGMVGVIAVILFMVLLYKVSGILGVISLMIYISLLLAILKIIPVTLTLPGIAGIILSVGMAVDANILVFERLKEEFHSSRQGDGLSDGKSRGSGDFLLILNHAYARAWTSIRDGNVSTLITCLILFWFSTSFIKGFALTLGIGVALSMFSAMIITKYLMRLVGEGRLGKKTWIWVR